MDTDFSSSTQRPKEAKTQRSGRCLPIPQAEVRPKPRHKRQQEQTEQTEPFSLRCRCVLLFNEKWESGWRAQNKPGYGVIPFPLFSNFLELGDPFIGQGFLFFHGE
jgi:hypothetical protein